ncbi:retinol dehydrogenase 12-like [Macrosteles quadrilineatus]|uniref:retinol dehydrogenase 12-like n=1 Tax=Macrosteles quadrilineatus TaxID=74068 RepID=UPI0023E30734|nr:retinol dehydrogenase 12-like [Macrosteles quadrilineatus]XP_054257494.1 retinol dehydrogenase 12-like [Macrosteles quadrilineatus]
MEWLLGFLLEHNLFTTVIVVMIGLWLYAYFTCGVCKSKARMDGKTVIITGANSGIGKQTALDLAKRGARVILACRNLEKANAAKDEISQATGSKNVIVKQLDVSLLSSVRRFAEEINKSEKRLDVLIHNAGAAVRGRNVTSEGLQTVWATNHYGPFLLTHLLIDLMKKTGKSRIIFVSSYLHNYGCLHLKTPNPTEETSNRILYQNTKFASVMFSNELARRLEGTGITANSLHPGVIFTSIWADNPWYMLLFVTVFNLYFKSEEQGAQTTIYLAVSEEVEGVSGKYFYDCKEHLPAKKSRDVEYAKKFWEVCEEVVKLKPTDPHI